MAGAGGSPATTSSSPYHGVSTTMSSGPGLPPPSPTPKILLAKPPSAAAAVGSGARDDEPTGFVVRSRTAPQPLTSLSLLSGSSWELQPDKILPFLTENSDFLVIGIIGPPGAGKSLIMNELYGYDGSTPGMLPPFATQSDETKTTAKHGTVGVELRVSAERLILLDSQPVFSPSILVDMTRPDGSSAVPVLPGSSLSADLAHELMGIQLGVFLASVCNILLVVSEGIQDFSMWELMQTVDMLKHNIPDPSLLVGPTPQNPSSLSEKEKPNCNDEYMPNLYFVHTRLYDKDLSLSKMMKTRDALSRYFSSSSFSIGNTATLHANQDKPPTKMEDSETIHRDLFFLPAKLHDSTKFEVGVYSSTLGMLRDQILSKTPRSFSRNISERDWLRSSVKIWDLVKKSPVIMDYSKMLQNSGLYRK